MTLFVVLVLVHGVGAQLAWSVFAAAEAGPAFFPSAGVALAAMVMLPPRRWWIVVSAIVVSGIAVDSGHGLGLGAAVGNAAANSVEPLAGAGLLLRLSDGAVRLDRRDGMLRFLVTAVGVGAGLGALIGGLTRSAYSDVSWWDATLHWWAGDGLSILAIGSVILACGGGACPRGVRLGELLIVLPAVGVASLLAFFAWQTPPMLLLLPVLVAVALRYTTTGVLLANAVMASVANVATARGYGPFAALDMSDEAQFAFTQLYLGSVITTVWFLAVEKTARIEAAVQREQERASRHRAESGRDLRELSEALVGQASAEGVAELVASRLGGGDAGQLAFVVLQDPEEDRARAHPATLPDDVRSAVAGWSIPATTPGTAATSLAAPIWADARCSLIERFPELAPLASALEPGAVGILPLKLGDEMQGCLLVTRGEERAFDPDEQESIAAVARLVAQAIERARLLEAEKQANSELQYAHDLVFELLEQATNEALRLKESEERFKLLADQSPMMVWVHDTEGKQEWVNRTFCAFFGVEREAMRGSHWRALVHPDDLDDYVSAFDSALVHQAPFHSQVRVRDGAGAWRWIESWGQPRVDPSGRFLGHVGASADVTDRHQAEIDVAAARQFVQEVTALVPGVISVWDFETDSNIFMSRQPSEFLGYEPDDAPLLAGPPREPERFISEILHPDDSQVFVTQLQAARRLADDESASCDYRLRHEDGTWRWLRTTSVPLRRGADGEVVLLASLTIDTTAEKRREAEVQAAAALDSFRAGLADALSDLDGRRSIRSEAARLLAEHLDVTVRVIGSDDRDESVSSAEPIPADAVPEWAELVRAMMRTADGEDLVVVGDVRRDGRLAPAERATAARLGIGSAMLHALRVDEEPDGILLAYRADAHGWSRHETAAAKDTVDRLLQAVQRDQRRQARELQQKRSALLVELIADLEAQPTVGECIDVLVDALVASIADYATVEQYDLPAGDGRVAALPAEPAPWSHVTVPLDLGRGARGALRVGKAELSSDGYTSDDLDFLRDLVGRVEVVLGAKAVQQAEHEVAVTLQKALLPDRIRWHPAAAVEARYLAASELLNVGGDWYDTFSWPGHLGVMVGDVVGHNLESAAAMGRLRAAAAALAVSSDHSPSALLTALDLFARSPDGVSYATAACVVIETATGRMTYATAGHPPPLLVAPDGTIRRLEQAQSPPLGILQPCERPESTLTIEPGSLVLLYSDGLVERRRESIDLGIARLEDAIRSRCGRHTSAIIDDTIAELTALSSADDDIVVAGFRYTPALDRVRFSVPALPDQLAPLRRRIGDWLTARHTAPDAQRLVQVAVGEACANAIDHAYRRPIRQDGGLSSSESTAMVVELVDHGHEIVARVSDRGAWRPPGQHGTGRGYGTAIMRSLSSHFECTTTSAGTTITLSVPSESRQSESRQSESTKLVNQ